MRLREKRHLHIGQVKKELSDDTPPVHLRAQLVAASVLDDAAMQATNSIWAPTGTLRLRGDTGSVRDGDGSPPPSLRLHRDSKAVGLKQLAQGSKRRARRGTLTVQVPLQLSPKDDEEVRTAIGMRAQASYSFSNRPTDRLAAWRPLPRRTRRLRSLAVAQSHGTCRGRMRRRCSRGRAPGEAAATVRGCRAWSVTA